MASDRVLVLNATGKVGLNACRALKEAGFEVYGPTRLGSGALEWRENRHVTDIKAPIFQ